MLTGAFAVLFAALAVVLVSCTSGQVERPSTAEASHSQPTGVPSATEPVSGGGPAFPPAGILNAGQRYDLTLDLVPATVTVPTSKWGGNGRFLLWVHSGDYYERAHMFFWTDNDPAGVFADPCAGEASPPVGPAAADLAAAIAGLPGTELVSGPTEASVDGRVAQVVEILLPEDIQCDPGDFLLWYSLGCETEAECARWASWADSIIRLWVIDLGDGSRGFIEAERYADDDPAIDEEFQAIVDSIEFD
jgi:hypothetical protein